MSRKQKGSDERGDLIRKLIEMYDVKSISDIQDALKDLLGGTIQGMLESELDELASLRFRCPKTATVNLAHR